MKHFNYSVNIREILFLYQENGVASTAYVSKCKQRLGFTNHYEVGLNSDGTLKFYCTIISNHSGFLMEQTLNHVVLVFNLHRLQGLFLFKF